MWALYERTNWTETHISTRFEPADDLFDKCRQNDYEAGRQKRHKTSFAPSGISVDLSVLEEIDEQDESMLEKRASVCLRRHVAVLRC